jgi:hypothetical protein
MSASTIILVILLILLSVLIGMIKFTKLGQKWFCPTVPKVEEKTEKKE